MVKSIYSDWVGVGCHCFASCHMGDTHRVHRFPLSDHYSCRFCIMAFLNRWRFSVTNWNYSGRAITIGANSIDYTITTDLVHSYQLAWSTNQGGSWAVAAKMLFYLSLHSNLSYSITVFQHHSDHSRSSSWLELYTHTVSQKFTEGKQLLFFLSHFARSFCECSCSLTTWWSNQVAHSCSLDRSNTEAEVEKTNKIIRDSMGHLLSTLHKPHMH